MEKNEFKNNTFFSTGSKKEYNDLSYHEKALNQSEINRVKEILKDDALGCWTEAD